MENPIPRSPAIHGTLFFWISDTITAIGIQIGQRTNAKKIYPFFPTRAQKLEALERFHQTKPSPICCIPKKTGIKSNIRCLFSRILLTRRAPTVVKTPPATKLAGAEKHIGYSFNFPILFFSKKEQLRAENKK